MITPNDLPTIPEDVARRVLVLARSIAPCLDALTDEPRRDAIAILRGIGADIVSRGARSVQSQRIANAQVTYAVTLSSFSTDDRSSLRALCASGEPQLGLPRGSFPEAGTVAKVWPEGAYS